MSVQIEVIVVSGEREYIVLLPQPPNDLLDTLSEMNEFAEDSDGYEISCTNSSMRDLNPCIAHAEDIVELNCLANLLNACGDKEVRTFIRCFNPHKAPPSMSYLIKVAHHFNKASHSIFW